MTAPVYKLFTEFGKHAPLEEKRRKEETANDTRPPVTSSC